MYLSACIEKYIFRNAFIKMKKLCGSPKKGSNSTLFKAYPTYTYKTYIITMLYTTLYTNIYTNITILFRRSELACIELIYTTYIIPSTSYKLSIQAKSKAMLVIALPVKAENCKPIFYIYYVKK